MKLNFSYLIILGTLVVQCTSPEPNLSQIQQTPETLCPSSDVKSEVQAFPLPSQSQVTPKVSPSTATDSFWLFAKEENDWVSVRTIQQKSFAVLKGKGSK